MRSIAARLTTALVVLSMAGAGLLAVAGPADAVSPGSLDTTWNGTGIATTSIGGVDVANAVVVQPDGETVAAGTAQTSGGSAQHFGLVRYTTSGGLDTTFGSGGEVVTPSFFAASNGDQANAVALQPDGKIVVAGSASNSAGAGALAVARYDSDGTLDSSFGSGGQAMVTVGDGSYNAGEGMAIEPNGKIVVVGIWFGGWAVARFTAAGVLDTTFNPAGAQPGVQTFDLGDAFFDDAYAVTTETVDGQTDILVGGAAAHNPAAGAGAGNEDFGLVRLTDTGAFDTSFGNAGVVTTDLGGDVDQISALVVQPDGKIDAAGQSGDASGPRGLAIARYSADGSLDTSFNGTGTEIVEPADSTDTMRGLGVLADGSILASATYPLNSGDIELVKMSSSGVLDSSFGSDGLVTTNVAQDEGNALAIDPTTGGVVVAGTAREDTSDASFLITRYFLPPPAPTITAVSPKSGPVGGGATVTITGSNFTGATAVKFASVMATSFTVVSATTITAVTPAHAARVVDVRVTTTSGTSPGGRADYYTFQDAPTVTAVSPKSGPVGGGATVTITGSNFTGATAVKFASVMATSFTVVSATTITAVTPAHAARVVDVRVTTTSGTSPGGRADYYTFQDAPTVTAVSPKSGPVGGGATVTITGSNFTGATAVKFASVMATSFTVVSATTITAVTPAHAARVVDVRVTTTSGTSPGGRADYYTFQDAPTVTAVSPKSGPVGGGATVTITGSNFTGATAVKFASVMATSFTVVSATTITAVTPAHAARVVDVRVTTTSGTSPGGRADYYTYQ